MTKEEVLEALDGAGVDYEIVDEHNDGFHIIVRSDEEEDEDEEEKDEDEEDDEEEEENEKDDDKEKV
jgi:hypothetical protein